MIISLFIAGGGETAASASVFGVRQFEVILFAAPAYYLTLLFRAIFNGLGNGLWPMVSGLLEAFARIAAVFLLLPRAGGQGLYVIEPIGWPLMAALLIIVYIYNY